MLSSESASCFARYITTPVSGDLASIKTSLSWGAFDWIQPLPEEPGRARPSSNFFQRRTGKSYLINWKRGVFFQPAAESVELAFPTIAAEL